MSDVKNAYDQILDFMSNTMERTLYNDTRN